MGRWTTTRLLKKQQQKDKENIRTDHTWLWRLAKGVTELLSVLLLCCWPTDVAVLTSGIGGGNSTSTSSSSFVPGKTNKKNQNNLKKKKKKKKKKHFFGRGSILFLFNFFFLNLTVKFRTDLKLVPWRETSSWRVCWHQRQLFPVLDLIRLSWWIRRSLYCPFLRLSWPAAANEKLTTNKHRETN